VLYLRLLILARISLVVEVPKAELFCGTEEFRKRNSSAALKSSESGILLGLSRVPKTEFFWGSEEFRKRNSSAALKSSENGILLGL
jgi:hypothetical protein